MEFKVKLHGLTPLQAEFLRRMPESARATMAVKALDAWMSAQGLDFSAVDVDDDDVLSDLEMDASRPEPMTMKIPAVAVDSTIKETT